MAKRKKVFEKTTTNKNDFLDTLKGALINYSLQQYDIETYIHGLMGIEIYNIVVYKC